MVREADSLVGEWHDLADQPQIEIEAYFRSIGVGIVSKVLNRLVGDSPALEFASASEFAQFVTDLRQNEKAWSRQLGNEIIRAHELEALGDVGAARSVLTEFIQSCPWKVFCELASIQLGNIEDQ